MAVFFISDTHFGHENIIRMCRRPFGSVTEMDEALVARWNERVGATDTILAISVTGIGAAQTPICAI